LFVKGGKVCCYWSFERRGPVGQVCYCIPGRRGPGTFSPFFRDVLCLCALKKLSVWFNKKVVGGLFFCDFIMCDCFCAAGKMVVLFCLCGGGGR